MYDPVIADLNRYFAAEEAEIREWEATLETRTIPIWYILESELEDGNDYEDGFPDELIHFDEIDVYSHIDDIRDTIWEDMEECFAQIGVDVKDVHEWDIDD